MAWTNIFDFAGIVFSATSTPAGNPYGATASVVSKQVVIGAHAGGYPGDFPGLSLYFEDPLQSLTPLGDFSIDPSYADIRVRARVDLAGSTFYTDGRSLWLRGVYPAPILYRPGFGGADKFGPGESTLESVQAVYPLTDGTNGTICYLSITPEPYLANPFEGILVTIEVAPAMDDPAEFWTDFAGTKETI